MINFFSQLQYIKLLPILITPRSKCLNLYLLNTIPIINILSYLNEHWVLAVAANFISISAHCLVAFFEKFFEDIITSLLAILLNFIDESHKILGFSDRQLMHLPLLLD